MHVFEEGDGGVLKVASTQRELRTDPPEDTHTVQAACRRTGPRIHILETLFGNGQKQKVGLNPLRAENPCRPKNDSG